MVPKANLIGKLNRGFLCIMRNFNNERAIGCAMSVRGARNCLEDAIKYARNRRTFGKRLIDHDIVRYRIMHMARKVQAAQCTLEMLTYQIETLGSTHPRIGGPMGLFKVHATEVLGFCVEEASQVLGGAAFIRGGVGARIELARREQLVAKIGAGATDVMLLMSSRQSKL
jgi:alkylation response protein AidB-like acyl-CoA dehydrogenase